MKTRILFAAAALLLLPAFRITSAADRLYERYPLKELEKTSQSPVSMERLPDGNVFADFGKAAFGQLKLAVISSSNVDTVIVHLGEAARDGPQWNGVAFIAEVAHPPANSPRQTIVKMPK